MKKQLAKKYEDVLRKHDWKIIGYYDDGRVELETFSPAGEDFCVCVDVENFPQAMQDYADDFDINEHIEMWILAKRNGVSGVPSASELVDDAFAIQSMLNRLALDLRACERLKAC